MNCDIFAREHGHLYCWRSRGRIVDVGQLGRQYWGRWRLGDDVKLSRVTQEDGVGGLVNACEACDGCLVKRLLPHT
jgi:hypothetical protein